MTELERAIDAITSDPRIRKAMRLAALLEGGSLTGPWPSGDNGDSHGPFQINQPAHPNVTKQLANDPEYAVTYMYPRFYEAAARVASEHPTWWQTNAMMAAAWTVFYAERPREMYPLARIQAAWAWITGKPSGGGDDPDLDPTSPQTPGNGATNVGFIPGLPDIPNPFTRQNMIRVAAVVLGVVLLFGGVLFVMAGPTGEAVGTVINA